jgi:hypothetical protein
MGIGGISYWQLLFWKRRAYKILVVNPKGMRSLGSPSSRLEENMKMYL